MFKFSAHRNIFRLRGWEEGQRVVVRSGGGGGRWEAICKTRTGLERKMRGGDDGAGKGLRQLSQDDYRASGGKTFLQFNEIFFEKVSLP